MTSLELLAALAKRYNITGTHLETLPGAIMAAINSEFSQNNSRQVVLQSLATLLGISLDPNNTFAARAHDAIRAKAAHTDDLINMLAAHYNRGHVPAADLPSDLAFHLRIEFEQSAEHYQVIRELCTRYSVPMAPLDSLAKRLLSHFAQMERDAAEAHSAAKALGVEVKDLADRAKQMTQGSTDLEQRQRLIHVLAEQMANIRRRLAVPVNESVMVHLDDLLSQRDLFQANAVNALDRLARAEAHLQAVVEALPPEHRGATPIALDNADRVADLVDSFVRLHEDAMVLWEGEIVDARKVLNHSGPYVPLATLIRDLQADRDRMLPMAATLQAINEALPPDLRHSDDLPGAVRSFVLTAETRYRQWDELSMEAVPAVQTITALRHALESPHLRLALARELYDADDNLLDLLETADAHQMTEALLATLATNRAARTEYPPLPKPSALARTLEGPAKVAYFNHSRRAGRVEAIGDDLIRFYPVEGDPVTLNATRRDLEVYHLTADELTTEIARAEARKTPPAETPSTPRPPDVADDDLPF